MTTPTTIIENWTTIEVEVLTGPDSGKIFSIQEPYAYLGRDPANLLYLTDNLLSRKHGSIEKSLLNSHYIFTDTSRNGTYYVMKNNTKPDCTIWKDSRILKPGDKLMLGHTTLLILEGKPYTRQYVSPTTTPSVFTNQSSMVSVSNTVPAIPPSPTGPITATATSVTPRSIVPPVLPPLSNDRLSFTNSLSGTSTSPAVTPVLSLSRSTSSIALDKNDENIALNTDLLNLIAKELTEHPLPKNTTTTESDLLSSNPIESLSSSSTSNLDFSIPTNSQHQTNPNISIHAHPSLHHLDTAHAIEVLHHPFTQLALHPLDGGNHQHIINNNNSLNPSTSTASPISLSTKSSLSQITGLPSFNSVSSLNTTDAEITDEFTNNIVSPAGIPSSYDSIAQLQTLQNTITSTSAITAKAHRHHNNRLQKEESGAYDVSELHVVSNTEDDLI